MRKINLWLTQLNDNYASTAIYANKEKELLENNIEWNKYLKNDIINIYWNGPDWYVIISGVIMQEKEAIKYELLKYLSKKEFKKYQSGELCDEEVAEIINNTILKNVGWDY